MAEPDDRVASGYDTFFASWDKSPALRRIWRDHVTGPDYPQAFAHISFLPLAPLRALAAGLQLTTGEQLVDVGCGAGGPGLWVAVETGAVLVGVDLSPIAVDRANERAKDLNLSTRAAFRQGSFESTGLGTGFAHAAMTIDALQYAPDKRAAIAEFARIIRPGGRLCFVAFELDAERLEGLGVWEDAVGDYRPLLIEAGFDLISYEQIVGWEQSVEAGFGAVIEEQGLLSAQLGEEAGAAIALEAAITLQLRPYRGHVLAITERRSG